LGCASAALRIGETHTGARTPATKAKSAAGLFAEKIRLVAEQRRQRLDVADGARIGLRVGKASRALRFQRARDLAPDHRADDRPQRRRRGVEQLRRAAREIAVVEPTAAHDEPIEMILSQIFSAAQATARCSGVRPATKSTPCAYSRRQRISVESATIVPSSST